MVPRNSSGQTFIACLPLMQSDSDERSLLMKTRRMASFTKIFNGLAVVHWALPRESRRGILLLHAGQLGREIDELAVVGYSQTKEKVRRDPISSSQANLNPGRSLISTTASPSPFGRSPCETSLQHSCYSPTACTRYYCSATSHGYCYSHVFRVLHSPPTTRCCVSFSSKRFKANSEKNSKKSNPLINQSHQSWRM